MCAGLIYKQQRHTKDIDSNVDMFLSRLVLGSDGITSRVAPQTDRDGHDRCSVCGLNLNIETQNEEKMKLESIKHEHK